VLPVKRTTTEPQSWVSCYGSTARICPNSVVTLAETKTAPALTRGHSRVDQVRNDAQRHSIGLQVEHHGDSSIHRRQGPIRRRAPRGGAWIETTTACRSKRRISTSRLRWARSKNAPWMSTLRRARKGLSDRRRIAKQSRQACVTAGTTSVPSVLGLQSRSSIDPLTDSFLSGTYAAPRGSRKPASEGRQARPGQCYLTAMDTLLVALLKLAALADEGVKVTLRV
jgi:hypothetical protein